MFLPIKGSISIFLIERTNSIDSASGDSQDEKDSDSDNSYEHVKSISSLNTSISRGLSISVIKQKTAKVRFDIVETRITGRRKHVVSTVTACALLSILFVD